MQNNYPSLPYFDFIFRALNKKNVDVETAFGRHVHWGYWKDPGNVRPTVEEYYHAAEELCRLVCDAGKIQDHMRVLDCGCGFGGTIASLNERFQGMDLVGLNIDERQLERARQKVLPLKNNQIQFIHGDACYLPFEDQSFDVVLAVECIFHFPDRAQFFREAYRVLKPGGRLALSDFIPVSKPQTSAKYISWILERLVSTFYGKTNSFTLEEYRKLAGNCSFEPLTEKNITNETIPTYRVLLDLLWKYSRFSLMPYLATSLIKWSHQLDQTHYEVLAYQK